MRDFVRKPRNWFLVMLVVAVMSALFINLFASTNKNLPSYQEGTDVEPPAATPEPAGLDFETIVYKNEELGFSMDVPADWSFVVKNGADSYVDTDGSMISFAVSTYDPSLNKVSSIEIPPSFCCPYYREI